MSQDPLDRFPFSVPDCPGGYRLVANLVTSSHNYLACICETEQRQVLLCEGDQDKIIIQVHATVCDYQT